MSRQNPNIVLIVAGNLGWGEPGCYGGGDLRGAPTPNIDRLASQGIRLQNFNVEHASSPTYAGIMSGRHAVRTGCMQSVPAGLPAGLNRNEITLAQLLSRKGYATALMGLWCLGDIPGRYPTDRGFDEWYGIASSADGNGLSESSPNPHIMQGWQGETVHEVEPYDLKTRRQLQASLVEKSIDFMQRSTTAGQPFFLYAPLAQLNRPALPHPDFEGRSGLGDFADCMLELDYRVGQLMAGADRLCPGNETVFIFCGDSGPEDTQPCPGTAGPWSGISNTTLEGGLRSPCIARWPGHIAAGTVTNEIVHAVDLFATLASMGGAAIPADRPIDSVDQTAFLTGIVRHSAREGFLHYVGDELRAVKWRNWKLHFYWAPLGGNQGERLESPYLFNLLSDPKEQNDVLLYNTWVMGPVLRMVEAFGDTVRQHPHTVPGAPDVDTFKALLQR